MKATNFFDENDYQLEKENINIREEANNARSSDSNKISSSSSTSTQQGFVPEAKATNTQILVLTDKLNHL